MSTTTTVTMPAMMVEPTSAITVEPITPAEGSKIDFGAVVKNVDIETLSGTFWNAWHEEDLR